MKAFIKSFLESWDRETTLTFVSLVVASYAWITSEKLIVAAAVGIAMHAIQVVAYEYLAMSFNWKRLEIADFARTHVPSRLLRLLSKTQNA